MLLWESVFTKLCINNLTVFYLSIPQLTLIFIYLLSFFLISLCLVCSFRRQKVPQKRAGGCEPELYSLVSGPVSEGSFVLDYVRDSIALNLIFGKVCLTDLSKRQNHMLI